MSTEPGKNLSSGLQLDIYDNHMLCNSNEKELQLRAVMFSKPVQLVAREGAVKIQGTESIGHLVAGRAGRVSCYSTAIAAISCYMFDIYVHCTLAAASYQNSCFTGQSAKIRPARQPIL